MNPKHESFKARCCVCGEKGENPETMQNPATGLLDWYCDTCFNIVARASRPLSKQDIIMRRKAVKFEINALNRLDEELCKQLSDVIEREAQAKIQKQTEQCFCKSYYDGETDTVKDCTCGKCADALNHFINKKKA